nr:tetracycline resistance protein, class A-like [Nerophis lumbriciformis]
MTEGKLELKRLWVLMITAFVDMIGFALIMPLLPFFATRFGASPSIIGVLIAIFALAQLISAPLWGRLSDRFGRRPVLLGGQALAAASFLMFAAADSVWLLLASRFLQGIGGGTISAAQAYVGDAVGPDERAKALGWITACSSAGVMVGPAIASLSVRYSYAAPGLIAAAMSLASLVFAWRWLPESSAPRIKGEALPLRPPLLGAIANVLRRPGETVSALIWIYSAAMMAFMALNGIMALYLAAQFGVTERNIGWFYLVIGAVSVVMRAIVLGKAVARFGEVRVLRIGALLLALGMATAPLATHPLLFLLSASCIPAGTSLLFPSTTSLVSRHSPKDSMGQSLGVQQAMGGISRMLGPLWATAIFERLGHAQPFWIGAALVLATVLFSLRLKPRAR